MLNFFSHEASFHRRLVRAVYFFIRNFHFVGLKKSIFLFSSLKCIDINASNDFGLFKLYMELWPFDSKCGYIERHVVLTVPLIVFLKIMFYDLFYSVRCNIVFQLTNRLSKIQSDMKRNCFSRGWGANLLRVKLT